MGNWRSNLKSVCRGVFLFCVLLSLGVVASEGSEKVQQTSSKRKGPSIPDHATVFDLKEISAFDVPEPVWYHFTAGQYVKCGLEPNEQVGHYPQFKSARPLYGALVVGVQPGRQDAGLCYQFAVDESTGPGRGYDRLYFDSNRNGDLTDDGYKTPRRDIPKMDRFESPGSKANVCFDFLQIGLEPGDDAQHRLEVMPRLHVYENAQTGAYVFFITTKAHEGVIQVGDAKFTAVLGHYGDVDGWFDHPRTALHILPVAPAQGRPAWRGGMQLSSVHKRDGVYYRFAATPAGDRLFVWPYQGPFGTLEIGTGGRNVGDASILGSLGSRDMAVALSAELTVLPIKPVRSCRLPVGDYYPDSLSVTYGRLDFTVLRNAHADGRPLAYRRSQPQAGAVCIREDKPFIFDFSSKPQVLFAAPARDLRLRPGAELNVKAVLIDPTLDIMFRQIRAGQPLNPTVTVKRANGATVAEGVMPFG